MLSLRAHLIICGSLFAALVLLVPIGGALQASGLVKNPAALRLPVMVLVLGLFVAFGFSCVPVMVKLVLGAQRSLGNADVPAVRAALRLETAIIWGMWALMALGMVIAIPAAIADGAFGLEAQRGLKGAFIPKAEGVLVARPGMTVAELKAGSTVGLEAPPNAPVYAGQTPFDFRVPGSGITFPGCRYFFISTFTHDASRIEAVNVGLSHDKLTAAERDAADADLGRKLAADGWLTGHEVYRTEEDQQLHGGLKAGPSGRVWLKDGVVLSLEDAKVDDSKPGEDPAGAAIWIQAISLWGADDYSGLDRYVFAKAGP
jgi:hypothetical protein